ncbi:MAG TPA: ATP-binding protein [Longimicrobium sp.]|nr:ATP-binding protein [Longimicrobium sp.]
MGSTRAKGAVPITASHPLLVQTLCGAQLGGTGTGFLALHLFILEPRGVIAFLDRGDVVQSLTYLGDAGADAVLRVRDTGMGIGPAELERVFEPFWQADQRLAREHGGSGLGLAVARQLARLLGGDVTAQSVPAAGSTFTPRLPKDGSAGESALVR